MLTMKAAISLKQANLVRSPFMRNSNQWVRESWSAEAKPLFSAQQASYSAHCTVTRGGIIAKTSSKRKNGSKI